MEGDASNTSIGVVKAPKKSKGLSFEEKRKRMVDYFMDKKDFFQLKELERFLPKEKGIVSQSVKEVLQSLVDDRLVEQEKIGTSNYFFSFPSQALQKRRNKIEQLMKEISSIREQIIEVDRKISLGHEERFDDGRKEILSMLLKLRMENKDLKNEVEIAKELDPSLFDEKKENLLRLKGDIDTLTDNIFSIQGYCVNNFSISRSSFLEQFSISEDFDYIT